jgi:4-amino-4-deoxy-L-arabinose transferase-like glycosyltransferase
MRASTTERETITRAAPALSAQRRTAPAWLIALGLAVVALLPRCVGLADFYTIDEAYHWPARVRLFAEALGRGDWAATDLTGHPGVTTMWLGALGRWLGQLAGVHDLGGSGAGAVYLAALRLPLAIVNGLAIVAGYLALRRLARPAVALLAGLLWATSPFLVAHGRLLHLDALLTTFMTLSVLLLLVATTDDRRPTTDEHWWSVVSGRWSVVGSGVCAGLALLTKAPSLFLLPFAGLLLVADWRHPKSAIYNLQSAMLRYLLWLGTAALVVVLLWPALWAAPLTPLGDVYHEIVTNGGEPEPAGNFFLGSPVAAPGWSYYALVLALRSTPLTLVGLALLPLALRSTTDDRRLTTDRLRDKRQAASDRERRTLVALLAFALLFSLMMTIEPKKFDRYLLPIWPALEILAAAGLVWLVDWLRRKSAIDNPRYAIGWAALTLIVVANLAWYHPYYLAYYNPLLGGGTTAERVMLVGWGEGMERIGAWLRARPDLKRGPVLSWIPPTLAPFVPAAPGVLDLRVPLLAQPSSYAVLYVRSVQRKESAVAEAFVRQTPPLYTLRMHGITYATIHQLPRPFDTQLDAQFGDRLHMRGFTSTRAGGTLTITPSWDVQADQPGGRFCFVHLLAPDGRRVAQVDALLDQGMFPSWQAGQQFDTPFPLRLPADLQPGAYRVVLGVYAPDSARLPLRSGPAAPADLAGPDALLLATIDLP